MQKRNPTWWALRGMWQGVLVAIALVVLATLVEAIHAITG